MILEGEQEAFAQIVEQMGHGIIVINSQKEILTLNAAARQFLDPNHIDPALVDWPKAYGLFQMDKTHYPVADLPMIRSLNGEQVTCEIFVQNDQYPQGRIIRMTSTPIENKNQNRVGALAVFYDVSEQKNQIERIAKINQNIKQLAYHDVLTNVLNKRGFYELAKGIFKAAKKNERPLAVLSIDLDNFHAINTEFGSAVGDDLLRKTTHLLCGGLRKEDLISRVGTDEFILLFSDLNSEDEALLIAKRLIVRMREYLYPIQGKVISLSIRIGIAIYPDHGDDLSTLINLADQALEKAKQSSKTSVCLHKK